MSILFTSKNIGNVKIKNRFIHAPTHENMATEKGEVTGELIKRYRNIAQGGAGLIIPGFMYVHPVGKCIEFQTGIHQDEMIPGLTELAKVVHEEGSKILFELTHAGRQTKRKIIGQTPIAPSIGKKDPVFRVKPREMTIDEIREAINWYSEAAQRAVESGADGVHIGAGAGYLVNQFLSPFFNHRTDEWGGSDENRFRFLKDIILASRRTIPKDTALTVKLNVNDYTPEEGVTPDLAKKYADWLVETGIDGLEIATGTMSYSSMNLWLGDVPVSDYARLMPSYMRPLAWFVIRGWVGKYDLTEGWNLETAKMIKAVLGETPLFLVGGLRRLHHMEEIIQNGYADFISLSRPLIREPDLVNKFQKGEAEVSSCNSCNKCTGAMLNNLPTRCYQRETSSP